METRSLIAETPDEEEEEEEEDEGNETGSKSCKIITTNKYRTRIKVVKLTSILIAFQVSS